MVTMILLILKAFLKPFCNFDDRNKLPVSAFCALPQFRVWPLLKFCTYNSVGLPRKTCEIRRLLVTVKNKQK